MFSINAFYLSAKLQLEITQLFDILKSSYFYNAEL